MSRTAPSPRDRPHPFCGRSGKVCDDCGRPAADEHHAPGPHTPGPWVRMRDAYTERGEGITLGTTDHTEPVCSVSGYLRPLEANARLIQAAPETAAERDRLLEENTALVAALREAVEYHSRYGDEYAWLDQARAALAAHAAGKP